MSSMIQSRLLARALVQNRTRRHLRWIAIILAALALPGALLAGCSGGGSSFPGTYQCTAPQHPVGCATTITFTHSHINPDTKPDIAANPLGIYSQVLLVPLTCDAACQASSGNGNPPGFISNYVELSQVSGGYLRVGYTTTPNGMHYFLQYFLPSVNNGQYTYQNLAPASPGNGPYGYATFDVGKLPNGTQIGNPGDWLVIITTPQNDGGGAWVNLGQATFAPDHVAYGQFIYGTSGATGLLAAFVNNNIMTVKWGVQEFVTEDGVPPSPVHTVDHPTDAGWLIPATKSSSGGMFYVSCCN